MLRHTRIIVPASIVVIGIAAIVSGIAVSPRFFLAPPTILAFGALWLIRAQWLPALALITYALIPVTSLDVPQVLTVLSPGLIVTAVWLFRVGLRSDPSKRTGYDSLWTAAVFVLLTIMIAGTVATDFKFNAAAWSGTFVVTALLLGGRRVDMETIHVLTKTWVALAVGLAVYGMVEFVLERNLLYGPLYAAGPYPPRQSWDVYRIYTSLGHPLNNAVFFGMSLALAFGKWVRHGGSKYFLACPPIAVGLVLTGSRGGIIAAAAAVALVFVLGSRYGRKRFLSRVVVATVGLSAAIAVTRFGPLADRLNSEEAFQSALIRDKILRPVFDTAEAYLYLGAGPGSSRPAMMDTVTTHLILENSYLQLLLSIGALGVAAFIFLLLLSALRARRAGLVGAIGMLTSYAIAIAGFNYIEAQRPAHILLGLALLLAWGPPIHSATCNSRQQPLQDSTCLQLGSSAYVRCRDGEHDPTCADDDRDVASSARQRGAVANHV